MKKISRHVKSVYYKNLNIVKIRMLTEFDDDDIIIALSDC